MPPLKDLRGKRFGQLLVLKRSEQNANSGRAKWYCLCDCGREVQVISSNLINGNSKSCGHKLRGAGNLRWTGHGEISGTYWRDVIQGAKRRDLALQVTIEEAWECFLLQGRQCALSGRALILKSSRDGVSNASLDRIDSSQGYVSGNIQWLHKDINRIKMHLPQEEFIKICREVSQFNEGRAICPLSTF